VYASWCTVGRTQSQILPDIGKTANGASEKEHVAIPFSQSETPIRDNWYLIWAYESPATNFLIQQGVALASEEQERQWTVLNIDVILLDLITPNNTW
jgi:hypothetical protein